MKITRGAFELATAAAKDTEVTLWLAGDRGVITDVVVSMPYDNGSTFARLAGHRTDDLPEMMPFGMHRYGKVITKADPLPEQGCNLIDRDGRWQLVDECGAELPLEIV